LLKRRGFTNLEPVSDEQLNAKKEDDSFPEIKN
jgi:hypothetical protein